MAKFYDVIGYGRSTEVRPGVWEDVITERKYYGDVTRSARKMSEGEGLNNDISVQNTFSLVADAYAYEHIFEMRYIRWMGQYWKVTDVEVKRPRLQLRVGGVYNGQRAG